MNNLHGIKTNDFNIAHLNVRGMVSKIDEVKTLLSHCQFKVLCLSETFLKENTFRKLKNENLPLQLGIPAYFRFYTTTISMAGR